jgi:chemotaxis protein MotB
MRVSIVGHTDSDPIKKSKWADNWELSSQRSLSVLRYLIKRGIPEDLIEAAGRGASQPVADNSSSSGKAQNRRVEVVVHMK